MYRGKILNNTQLKQQTAKVGKYLPARGQMPLFELTKTVALAAAGRSEDPKLGSRYFRGISIEGAGKPRVNLCGSSFTQRKHK